MNAAGWIEILITLAVTVAAAWPLGLYLARVWQGERTWLDPVLRPVERLVYAGADAHGAPDLPGMILRKGQGRVPVIASLACFQGMA